MAEVDAAIPLGIKPIQLDNPMDIQAKGLQLSQLGVQTQAAQRDFQNQQTLADLYRNNIGADGSVNHNAIMAGMAQSGLGAQIPAYQKSLLDVAKTTADIGETKAKTGQADATTAQTQLETTLKNVQNVGAHIYSIAQDPNLTHDTAYGAINSWVNQGIINPDQGANIARNLPGDPTQLKSYLLQKATEGQTIEQQLQSKLATLPKVTYETAGNRKVGIDMNPLSPTYAPPASIGMGVSPDTSANITKDYVLGGMNPDGTPNASDGATIDAIGQGRMAPPSGAALLNPKNRRLMDEVMTKYPEYDYTTVAAKKAAAVAFTSGKEGNSLRSIGTATKHLDMLDGLVTALGNGDTPLLNKLGNAWSAQTGGTAPGNFDAAKEIVGQEVVKAIVAGGGGVSERAEAAQALSAAKTPAQLRGVISTYKSIMGAQHESLLQQRDAAGLPRSTLPDYTEGAGGAATAPAARPPLSAFGTKP